MQFKILTSLITLIFLLSSCVYLPKVKAEREYSTIRNLVRSELSADDVQNAPLEIEGGKKIIELQQCGDATILGWEPGPAAFSNVQDSSISLRGEFSARYLLRSYMITDAFSFYVAETSLIKANYPRKKVYEWIEQAEQKYVMKLPTRIHFKNLKSEHLIVGPDTRNEIFEILAKAQEFKIKTSKSLPSAEIGGECGGPGVDVKFKSNRIGSLFIAPLGQFKLCERVDMVDPYSRKLCEAWSEAPLYKTKQDIKNNPAIHIGGSYMYQIINEHGETFIGGPVNAFEFNTYNDDPNSIVIPINGLPL